MRNIKEKGFALILSLVLLLAMSLMGGALILISSEDHKSNNIVDVGQQTFYVAEMALSLFAANEGYFDDVEIKKVMAFEKALHKYARTNHNDLLEKINNSPDYNDEIAKSMKALMDDFKTNGVW